MSSESLLQLYGIRECPSLMSDACICDEAGNLIFFSAWGRDTAIQELVARLTVSPSEKTCLRELHLTDEVGVATTASITGVDRLQKRTGRTSSRTLFGPLIHLWLFDIACTVPDLANASAIAVMEKRTSNPTERLWALVRETCPLPLLDHWRELVLDVLTSQQMLQPLPTALGRLEAHRLRINIGLLSQILGDHIRSDTLRIPEVLDRHCEQLKSAA